MAAAYGEDSSRTSDSGIEGFHILIVDDHLETILLLSHLLRNVGTVHAAADFDEALRRANEVDFHLVLVDINLGRHETGLDLLKTLRISPRYANTPILACTAYALPGDQSRLLEEGFDGYISKPFSRGQLLSEINRFC